MRTPLPAIITGRSAFDDALGRGLDLRRVGGWRRRRQVVAGRVQDRLRVRGDRAGQRVMPEQDCHRPGLAG